MLFVEQTEAAIIKQMDDFLEFQKKQDSPTEK
jgi:hypothetical protein